MFLLKECKLVARKKKVKVPKEVLTSECRTVPKTECVDAKVRVMVIIIITISTIIMIMLQVPHKEKECKEMKRQECKEITKQECKTAPKQVTDIIITIPHIVHHHHNQNLS